MPYRDRERLRMAQRQHYEQNRDDYLRRSRIAGQRRRQVLNDAKDRPCADCGTQYPSYVMQFDHLDGDDKLFTIGDLNASLEEIIAEITKCEVVCANCHAERTHKRLQETRLNAKPALRNDSVWTLF